MGAERWIALALGLLSGLGVADRTQAQSVADVFRGKNLSVIIPSTPGGDRGGSASVFIAHFGKHVPGNPTVVASFMPGAGGAIGMNYLYSVAAKDGTAIGTPLTGFVVAQATGEKSVKYDVRRMHWLGRTASNNQILYVWHTTGVNDIEGAKAKQITIGSTGANSASTILPLMLNQVIGTKFKIIEGYNGSAAFNLAMERGETEGTLTTWGNVRTNHIGWVKDGRARVIVQLALARHPELASIPIAPELTSDPDGKALLEFTCSTSEIGQSFVTPPGVPAPVVAALRQAFEATMKDPEYIAATKKANIELNPMTAAQLDKLTEATLSAPQRIVERYRKAVGGR